MIAAILLTWWKLKFIVLVMLDVNANWQMATPVVSCSLLQCTGASVMSVML